MRNFLIAGLAAVALCACASQPEGDTTLYYANGEACPAGAPEQTIVHQRISRTNECRTKSGWHLVEQVASEDSRINQRRNETRMSTPNLPTLSATTGAPEP